MFTSLKASSYMYSEYTCAVAASEDGHLVVRWRVGEWAAVIAEAKLKQQKPSPPHSSPPPPIDTWYTHVHCTGTCIFALNKLPCQLQCLHVGSRQAASNYTQVIRCVLFLLWQQQGVQAGHTPVHRSRRETPTRTYV